MNFLTHLKIATRLMILVGLLSALLVVIGGLGLFGIAGTNRTLKTVYEDNAVPLTQLGEIRNLMAETRAQLLLGLQHYQTSPFAKMHDHPIDRHLAAVEANVQRVTALWQAYMASNVPDEAKALAKEFADKREAYFREGVMPVITAFKAERFQDANLALLTRLNPLATAANAASDKLVQLQLGAAKKAYDEAEARYATIRAVSIAAMAGGLLFAWVFGLFLVRGITRPVAQALDIAEKVAAGDLSSRIEVTSTDEVGRLLSALKDMNQSLVQDRRHGAQQQRQHRHRLGANRQRQRRPEPAHRRTGQRAGRNRRLDGTARLHRQAERRQRPAGQPAGDGCQHGGRTWRRDGQPGRRDHEGHQRQQQEDRRHHHRDRRHRLPDQHPGAQRGGGSGACRRTGPRFCGGGSPKCATWRNAAPKRPRKSRA
jgi:HAMP domain-containing protein